MSTLICILSLVGVDQREFPFNLLAQPALITAANNIAPNGASDVGARACIYIYIFFFLINWYTYIAMCMWQKLQTIKRCSFWPQIYFLLILSTAFLFLRFRGPHQSNPNNRLLSSWKKKHWWEIGLSVGSFPICTHGRLNDTVGSWTQETPLTENIQQHRISYSCPLLFISK